MSHAVFQTILLGHAVAAWRDPGNEKEALWNTWGLSHMQRALLSDTPWIRVVDAPTGSGKSYGFQKAVLPNGIKAGGNVLFVAPTRRLTENLAASLREGLTRETRVLAEARGLSPAAHTLEVEEAVLVWNGQQIIENASSGRTAHRKQQLRRRNSQLGLGATVFTVLEIVRDMLFPTRLVAGAGDDRGSLWLRRFQHVVFDEFHTLGPDGMALALVVVAMVQAMNRREQQASELANRQPRYTYLTFLSATPVDLLKFLEAGLGNDLADTETMTPSPRLKRLPETETGDGVCLVSERLIHADDSLWPGDNDWPSASQYRALHGDVTLEAVESESLSALVSQHILEVMDDLENRRQVVCLWDSKAKLMIEQKALESILQKEWHQRGHTNPLRVLVVHASADRERGNGAIRPELHEADVVLGTASLEAGVTFRDNRLLFMEPGFTAMNLVQRMGRCARGFWQGLPVEGRVVLRLEPDEAWRRDYRAWLSPVVEAGTKMPSQIRIDEFLSLIRRAAFGIGSEEEENGLYRLDDLDKRSQARAALFWAGCWLTLERAGKKRSIEWMGHPPGRVRWMKARLEALETLMRPSQVPLRRNHGPVWRSTLRAGQAPALARWHAQWRQESQALRSIAPSIWVIDTFQGQARARPFEMSWLSSSTNALSLGKPGTLEDAKNLLPNEDWIEGDVFLILPRGKEMEVVNSRDRRSKESARGQTFLMPLGAEQWATNNSEAAKTAAMELEALADRVANHAKMSRALTDRQTEELRRFATDIKAWSKLVKQTGRSVPITTRIDDATSRWIESVVV